MALQPKSNNLPENQHEPVVSAAPHNELNLVPGSENAADQQNNENLKGQQQVATEKAEENKCPTQAAKRGENAPVLGQQQQGKPSRTDNCHCPEIIEEKVKPVNPEDHDKPRKIITYSRGRYLGKGGFAKCYEVRRIEPIETEEHESTTWALKTVPKANLTRTKARQKLTSEIKIHRSLDHENVCRFDRYFEDKENVYIMLDICSNGSLSDLIKRRKRLHEVETRYYIHQLVRGIQYVHSRKVIHRDLKLGNLFLTDRMGLKVGDFGLAAQVFYQGEKKRTVCGTPNYLAPEVLEANGGHSYEVDYWSIGVILYTMLNGRPPFESQEVKQTYKKIRAGAFSFPEHVQIGSQAKDFIRKCLTVDTAKRMNLEEMLDHDFLSLVPVPKQMPVSTLVCPPASAFCKQYALPMKSSMAQNMSPSPMGSSGLRQKRILHHMQTAPMENALRQAKTQKSLGSGVKGTNEQLKGALYSPLVVNGAEASNQDNAHILGSEKTGATPGQATLNRQMSTGPAIISEFNPLNDGNKDALQNPQVIQNDQNALQQVLVDNFLKTQNLLSLGPSGKLLGPTEMKSVPSSPGGPGQIGLKNRTRQLQLAGSMVSNKARRLTTSVSSANIPEMRAQNFTPKSNYNSVRPQDGKATAPNAIAEFNDGINNVDQIDSKQQSSELAKIQPTSALTIDQNLLAQKSETQPRTELVIKFVDFSSKYGLGYMLSNGSYGVLFNDSTKIILHPNQFHFDYIERPKQQQVLDNNGQAAESVTDQVSHFDFFNYPESINKKVVLLQHFKSYLDGNQKFKPLEFTFTKENAPSRQDTDVDQLVYIKKWKRAKKAILLRNTNKIIQVMFQDQSELILCSGSGFVTFVNSKQEVKTMPLSVQNDINLEKTDKSLFKRLQYAKEILVQMMSAASMPSTLALNNDAIKGDELDLPAEDQNNYQTTKAPGLAVNARQSIEQPHTGGRHTRSASKGVIMSPYNSKGVKARESARTYRMHTMTAVKAQTTSTNLLNSNVKQQNKNNNKFELPLLSNRSSSKPNYVQQRNGGLKESLSSKQVTQVGTSMTSSHNFLPSKIGQGILNQPSSLQKPTMLNAGKNGNMNRLYQTSKDIQQQPSENMTTTQGSIGASQLGPAQPKMTAQKSPGKSFKHGRNTQSATTITTMVGAGVRKQQFVKM